MEYKVKGNVIPLSWYQKIVKANGKPDMNSIAVMGELLYWNRPVWKNNHWETPFPGNKFYIDYKKISKILNLTPKDIQRALRSLEELGVITRRMEKAMKGHQFNKRVFVNINYQKLEEMGGVETVDKPVDNFVEPVWINGFAIGQFCPDGVDKSVR